MNLSPAHEARLEFEAMVEQHRPLAHHLASRYRHTGEPFDDLLQTACEGLVKAVHRFEPDRGIPFSTFAVPTILGELRRHFRDRSWAMRVPRRLQELALKLDRATDELTAALGRRPTAAELATRLDAATEEIVEAREAASAYRIEPLSAADDDDTECSPVPAVDDEGFRRAEDRAVLRGPLRKLDPAAVTMLLLRFHDDLTQSEIAARMGCSQVQVSRVLRNGVEQLRCDAGER